MRELDDITGAIVDASVRLHRDLGPGLLESVYEAVLVHALEQPTHQLRCRHAPRGGASHRQRPSSVRVSASPREPISTGYQRFAASLTSQSVTMIPLDWEDRSQPLLPEPPRTFKTAARRQSLLVARSALERNDQAFVDAVSDRED
jgi:hypothetical protein